MNSASVDHSLSDAALRFLERIAAELALPMKKVEVLILTAGSVKL